MFRAENKEPSYWRLLIANLPRPSGRLLGETIADKALEIFEHNIERETKILAAIPRIGEARAALLLSKISLVDICRGCVSDIMIKNATNGKLGEKMANSILTILVG